MRPMFLRRWAGLLTAALLVAAAPIAAVVLILMQSLVREVVDIAVKPFPQGQQMLPVILHFWLGHCASR